MMLFLTIFLHFWENLEDLGLFLARRRWFLGIFSRNSRYFWRMSIMNWHLFCSKSRIFLHFWLKISDFEHIFDEIRQFLTIFSRNGRFFVDISSWNSVFHGHLSLIFAPNLSISGYFWGYLLDFGLFLLKIMDFEHIFVDFEIFLACTMHELSSFWALNPQF